MLLKTHATLFVLLVFLAASANADIVSVAFEATATADFDGNFDTITSTNSIDAISAFATADNSFSQSDLNWAWNPTTGTLTGGSMLTAEKTVSARPGGPHYVTSSYQFTFQTNSNMDISFGGNWGFDSIAATTGAGGESDSLGLTLTDGTSTIYSANTTSGTGVASDSFAYSGMIGPGTYVFSIDATLFETLNNFGTSNAAWDLTSFSMINAVPEPGAFTFVTLFLIPILARRTRQPGFVRASYSVAA